MLWVAQAFTVERQHRHGDRGFRILFCHFNAQGKHACRANYHAAAQKHKNIYRQTAEFHRKAAGGDTVSIFFPVSVCLSENISKITKVLSIPTNRDQPLPWRRFKSSCSDVSRPASRPHTAFCRSPAATWETLRQTEYF